MRYLPLRRTNATLVTLLFSIAVVAPLPSFAMELTPNTVASPPSTSSQSQGSTKRKKTKSSSGKQQRSDREFSDGFWVAYNLIYKDHDYTAGIAKLHSLGHDDDAAIANLIGYSSRKLGRYDDAKVWYEKSLAADPNFARTWSYYGMWYAEQGNLLKAHDILEKVRSICGTECKEYTELKSALEGNSVY